MKTKIIYPKKASVEGRKLNSEGKHEVYKVQ